MSNSQPPLIMCMENMIGEDVALKIEPNDNFQMFLNKAKSLLGFDVDINSITRNQPVSLTDNIYHFLINAEQNMGSDDLSQTFNPTLDTNDPANDLVYILDDGTQIRASQIHFDNDDPLIDITSEKIPFIKYADASDDIDIDGIVVEETKNINIVDSPISRWSSKNSSPKCSFVNSLPFRLVCNNTSGFEAQFSKYLEAHTSKTYATLNPVTIRDKSPNTLIKDNFNNYDEYPRNDNLSYTREDVLNMFKDSPMTSLPYDQGFSERKHVRKTDPSRIVHKNWHKPITYINMDGMLIGGNESQICFICGKHVDNSVDKIYLFDNEDQRLHRCSPQKKSSTELKIICDYCLNDNFRPCRMKNANQFLNPDEYLVIRNNQQYIFQKIKDFSFTLFNKVKDPKKEKEEFVNVEIGSDGEIVTKSIDNDAGSDVIIVKDDKNESGSSDVEIIEPEMEIDHIIDNLEEADEEVKEFLGKYSCDNNEVTELKCRFCGKIFINVSEVLDHCEAHKHDVEDEKIFPCPLCNYGYANLKWLKGHLKTAHESRKNNNNEKFKEEIKSETVPPSPSKSPPIAARTRSSNKNTGDERKDTENVQEDKKNDIEVSMELQKPLMKTDVKQEAVDSSEDEIWIVQTGDVEGSQELEKLLGAAQVSKDTQGLKSDKSFKCFRCSVVFPTAGGLASHGCKRRGRKRKVMEENVIRVPTKEDFLKRAQGRPRGSLAKDNDLCNKKRRNKSTWNPQIVTCNNCNESFTSKVRLKFHMQFHETQSSITAEGLYSCSECTETTFPTETELFDHVHFQHDKQKRWQCPVEGCRKTFFLRATLTKHSRSHTDTRRYVCVTCGKRFLDKQTLDEHGVTHLQIKPFQCHICLKQLTRRSRLRMHVRAHEEELSPRLVRVCAVCKRAFRDLEQAQEHATKSTECIEAYASELKVEDDEVSMQLSPTSGIVRHTVRVIESPKFSKPVKRQVSTEVGEPLLTQLTDEARALIRVVEIEKAFRCEYCEDVFYLEVGLNNHRTIHKGVKNPFICHICKVSFATYSRCTTHKTTHGFYKRSLADAKKQEDGLQKATGHSAAGILGYGDFPVVKHFLCEDCGRSYLHWTYLQVHRRMKHANENSLYKCNQCELTFPNSWSLAYHRKKIHGKTSPDDTANKKSTRDDYRIPCRDCEEILPNKTALYKHRKKEHSECNASPERNNIQAKGTSNACTHCPATFTHVQDLRNHLKQVHNQDPDVTCSACNKSFRSHGEYSAHLRTDCTRRPHTCPVCGHAFRTLSMRNEHLRVHTGERPFPCDVCGVAFRRSTAMRNHRLIHSGVRAWACGRCPKRFRIRSDLRTHLRLKHPATLLVFEMRGLNPSPDEVMNHLAMHNVSTNKVIEITKISFAKGTSNIVPDSTRALCALADVPRGHVVCKKTANASTFDEFQPARRGRGIAKNPRRPKILQRSIHSQDSTAYTEDITGEDLSKLNLQMLLRDDVLVNGNEMVQLQIDDGVV